MRSRRSSFNTPDRQLFAFPTESFYALGVPADDAVAIHELFRRKRREAGKPIALIAADIQQVKRFFHVSETESQYAHRHWPGALTLLLRPKKKIAADALFPISQSRPPARQPSSARRANIRIGVRVPRHAGARRLAAAMGAPITATSANISGQPPTKSRARVQRDFPGILIIPGRCGRQRRPSTIIKIDQSNVHIIRQGSVRVQ